MAETGEASGLAALESLLEKCTAARARAERRADLLSAFARGIICEFDAECRYREM